MNFQLLKENIAGVDIYIIDQILKERFQSTDKILDVGCGNGRNLKWFYNAGFEIHGTEINSDRIAYCKSIYPLQQQNFIVAKAQHMPYTSESFNHIICNAVLHFAEDLSQYSKMFQELLRILKPQAILFIRMASHFGMESLVEHTKNGVYNLPDGTQRFLLTKELLNNIKSNKNISLIESVKTTIVEGKRCMTTLVIKKK